MLCADKAKGNEISRMDLRNLVEYFRKNEYDVRTIHKEVDPKFELAAVARQLDGGPAVLFEKLKGSSIPVIVGLYSNRKRVSEIFGADLFRLPFVFEEALSNRMKPILVKKSPSREICFDKEIDLMKTLPILWHTPKDAGPYITAGIVIAKDPETDRRNVSIHRLQVIERDKLAICIAKNMGRHLETFLSKAEARKRPLEVTISIGVEPSVFFGGCVTNPLISVGEDELEVAGGIKGEPIELVQGEKVKVEAISGSEIILEGEILPDVRVKEGPFLDFANYYNPPENYPVVRIRFISHRKKPIYQAILGGTFEHTMPGSLLRELSVFKAVRAAAPSVKAVFLTPGGCCLFNVVISIKKEIEGQQRNAILAALSSHLYIKHAVIVDEDIDIYNPHEVEWAIATRFQGNKDLIVIPETVGHKFDPSSFEGRTTRVGVDATMPLIDRDQFERGVFLKVNVEDYFD